MTIPVNNNSAENLADKKCIPCEGGMPAMDLDQAKIWLGRIDSAWKLNSEGQKISREFIFKGFNKTMGFVNAIAWIANQESHHPDLEISYDRCTVHFQTHAVKGLTENDFICAKKIDRLLIN